MTVEDAQVVHDYLKPFVENGHIKAFTGNEYLAGLRERRHVGRVRLVR